MTILLLQWSLLTLSLVIATLLCWLALTVLLNAQRRDPGVWVTGIAMLAGTFFFLFHARLVSIDPQRLTPELFSRWPLLWMIGLLLPIAWYFVMLWHTGYWEQARTIPRRLPHYIFICFTAICTGVTLWSYCTMPFSLTHPMDPYDLFSGPEIAGIPVLWMLYPLYILACLLLSIDALRHPGAPRQLMGELARRRARPWLLATSFVLLLVSLGIAAAMLLAVPPPLLSLVGLTRNIPTFTALIDLAIIGLIALAVLLLGQAIVSYEVFTGKTLPRRGLSRNWRRIIILGVGLSAMLSANSVLNLRPIYGTVLAVVVISTFYALYNWRSYRERERYVASLRPFVTGPPIYDALTTSSATTVDIAAQFAALCEEVLGAEIVHLEALGSFASLVDPLSYPVGTAIPDPLPEIVPQCDALCLPLDGAHGLRWAVPLWSGRSLIGLLWLGDKCDGGLYTEEEMEIARATAERLIDVLAGLRLAQRLMQVQRGRMAESQVTDRRTRRVLHDDILPQLHTVILTLSARQENADALEQLADIHRQLSNILRELPAAATETLKRVGLVKALHQAVEDEYRSAFDHVRWELDPHIDTLARQLPPVAAEVVFCAAREAIRNAARYGRGNDATRPLELAVRLRKNEGIEIVIEDSGVGLQACTASAGGSGQGAMLHSTMMAVIGGAWVTDSEPGQYTRVTISLPEERCGVS